MNKQELISIIRTEVLLAKSSSERKGYIAALEMAINIIEGFSNEPQKPVVPQYIADFIEEQKKHGLTLSYSIDASMSDRVAEWYWDNPELFARAWLDGYEVEKEKRYFHAVKIKKVGSNGMSYDLEILVKIENGDYICIDEPKHNSPTYNLGKMFRVAMDWDFEQGTIYNVAQVLKNIQRGIFELEHNSEMYVQYEPENKWGTTSSALEDLKSLRDCIIEQDIDTKYLYMRW